LLLLTAIGAASVGYVVSSANHLLTDRNHFAYLYRLEGKEILRLTSPDKKVDAVVYCREAPAFSSNTYFMHLFPTGKKPDSSDAESDSAILVSTRPVNLRWVDPSHLQIDAGTGQLMFFTNLWMPATKGLPLVELDLIPVSGHRMLKPDGDFEE
jgi:hypothetical protein